MSFIKNKKLIIFIIILLAIFLAGIILPTILIRDESPSSFTPEQIRLAKQEAHNFFDNPIERLLIIKFKTWEINPKLIYVNAYTWGGIRYALLSVNLNDGSTNLVWRRWFDDTSQSTAHIPEDSSVDVPQISRNFKEEQAHIAETERISDEETKAGDEVQSSYIKNVYQKNGDIYIDADYFTTLTAKQAVLYCFNSKVNSCLYSPELQKIKDELIAKVNSFSNDPSTFEDQYYDFAKNYKIYGFDNGVWLDVNDNPKIRTFKLSPDVKIRLMKESGSYPDFNPLTPEEFMNAKNDNGQKFYVGYFDADNGHPYYTPYQLILKNGEVLFIHQIYRP